MFGGPIGGPHAATQFQLVELDRRSRGMEYALSEQVHVGTAKHRAFEVLESVNCSFDLAIAPGSGERFPDSVVVFGKTAGEAGELLHPRGLGILEPGIERLSPPLTHECEKTLGQGGAARKLWRLGAERHAVGNFIAGPPLRRAQQQPHGLARRPDGHWWCWRDALVTAPITAPIVPQEPVDAGHAPVVASLLQGHEEASPVPFASCEMLVHEREVGLDRGASLRQDASWQLRQFHVALGRASVDAQVAADLLQAVAGGS
jgi:hypothetical protein